MHRYFKKNENIIRVKKYLAECSVGDWFVLYQMSKNMNKRLFFDFLTSLAQVSRSDVLQVSKLIVHTHTHTHTHTHNLSLSLSKFFSATNDDPDPSCPGLQKEPEKVQ